MSVNTPVRPGVAIIYAGTHRAAEAWAFSRGMAREAFHTLTEPQSLRRYCKTTPIFVTTKALPDGTFRFTSVTHDPA